MKRVTLLCCIVLLAALPGAAFAQSPTPVPTPTEIMTSRTDLLAQISSEVKPIDKNMYPVTIGPPNMFQDLAAAVVSGRINIWSFYIVTGFSGLIIAAVLMSFLIKVIFRAIRMLKGAAQDRADMNTLEASMNNLESRLDRLGSRTRR